MALQSSPMRLSSKSFAAILGTILLITSRSILRTMSKSIWGTIHVMISRSILETMGDNFKVNSGDSFGDNFEVNFWNNFGYNFVNLGHIRGY